MIVLGHTDRSHGRIFTDRTFTGVAAHASCPVVAVPATWQDASGDKVVVGVADVEQADGPLEEAFKRAAASEGSLTIIHAWKIDNAYEDIIFGRVELEEIRRSAVEKIDTAIGGLRSAFPEVKVEVVAEHAEPATALLTQSREAGLIVMGRRTRHGLPDLQLGSTTRAVVRHAACPVEVVPVGTTTARSVTT